LAASANGLLGLAALGLGMVFSQKKSSPPVQESPNKPLQASLRAALVVAGLSGVAAMMDEVGYNRVLCMVLGGSAYAFSAMLTAFLTGLSAGSYVFSKGKTVGSSAVRRLAAAQVGLGVVVLLTAYTFDRLWLLFMELAKAGDHFHLDLDQWQKGIQFLVAFGVLFPTAFLSGAVFPLVLKADPGFGKNPAGKVGRIYGANTLGAILGALLASLALIPWVGVQKTLEAGVCLNFLAAGLLLISQWRPGFKKVFWPAFGLMLVLPPVLWAVLPIWNRHNLAVGPFFQAISASDYIPDFRQRLAESELLYYREGLVNTVTVENAPEFNTLVLSNNGKVEASSVGDLPTEQLVSHIPLLWRECTLQKPADKVAVIGLASGITAGSVLPHNPSQLDVVDLEPFMPQAAAFFKDFNFQILTDPHFHFIADDARHYFRLAPQKYDVIISEPSNPWLSGVSNLFSREFFEIGKRGLAEGGVYCQWVQIYGMQTSDVKAICRTFSSVFPYVYLFGIPPATGDVKPVPDLVLLGSLSPLKPHIPYMEKAVRSAELQKALGRIDVAEAGDLVSMLRMGPQEVTDFCEGAGLDTDDNGLIEFSAPLHLYDGDCYVANMMEIRKFQPDPTDYVEPESPAVLKKLLRRVAADVQDYWGNDFAASLRKRAEAL
jgi:spermidine synthase